MILVARSACVTRSTTLLSTRPWRCNDALTHDCTCFWETLSLFSNEKPIIKHSFLSSRGSPKLYSPLTALLPCVFVDVSLCVLHALHRVSRYLGAGVPPRRRPSSPLVYPDIHGFHQGLRIYILATLDRGFDSREHISSDVCMLRCDI